MRLDDEGTVLPDDYPASPVEDGLLPTADDVRGLLSDDPATVLIARASRQSVVPTSVAHEAVALARRSPSQDLAAAVRALRKLFEERAALWEGDADFIEEGDESHKRVRVRPRKRKASPRELAAETARGCAGQLREMLLSPEFRTLSDLIEGSR
jgi:hypothetical protein